MALSIAEIKSHLERKFTPPYAYWSVLNNRGFHVWTPWRRDEIGRGMFLSNPLETFEQVDALAELLLQSYKMRRPITFGSTTIEGYGWMKTQEELMDILHKG